MSRYHKVLVLLDLSDASEQVLIAGRDLAEYTQASIVSLHVVEFVPVEPLGESLIPTMQIEEDLLTRSRERLTQLIARVGLKNAKCRVEIGNMQAEILRVAAEEHADLIVLGSHERHGLALLVNFTDDRVLHAARCDVLAVRLT
jgi:universal stress protein A